MKSYDTICEEAAFDQTTGLPTLPILREHFQLLTNDETITKSSLIPVLIIQLNNAQSTIPALDLEESEQLLKIVGRRLTSCTITGVSGVAYLNPTLYALVLVQSEQNEIAGFISAQAQQVLNSVTHPYRLTKNKQVTIAANLGVAFYPCDGHTLEALLENAQIAMQQANADGENCYHFYAKY